VLTTTYGYSQNTPRPVVIEGDTLVLVPADQIRVANKIFLERDYYREYCDSLKKENVDKLSLISLYKTYAATAESTVQEQSIQISNYKKLVKNGDEKVKVKDIEIKQIKKKKLKATIVAGAIGTIIGIFINR
jgi:hypothetical protein